MIWNEDFDPKIRTFWVLGGGGKEKMELCGCLLGVLIVTHVNSRRGIFNFYFENERNYLSKEHDSIFGVHCLCRSRF